MDEQMSGML